MNALRRLAKDWQLWVGGALVAGALFGFCVWILTAYNYNAVVTENHELRKANKTTHSAGWDSGPFRLKVDATQHPDETKDQLASRLKEHTAAGAKHFPPDKR